MSDNKSFVSRRGKRVGLETVNITDVSIDDEADKATEQVEPPRIVPEAETAKRPWKRWVFVVLVLIALPVAGGEYVTRQFSTSGSITKEHFKSLTSSAVIPLQARDDVTAAQLYGIAEKVQTLSEKMCENSQLDMFAMLYPRVASAHRQCQIEQEKYTALKVALQDYAAEREYLEKLAVVLQPLSAPQPERFAVIGTQLDMWRAAEVALQKLSPPPSLKTIHETVHTNITTIMEDWSKLGTAYKEQKSVEFIALQKKLKRDYGSLQANGSSVSDAVQSSQLKLTNAYKLIGQ